MLIRGIPRTSQPPSATGDRFLRLICGSSVFSAVVSYSSGEIGVKPFSVLDARGYVTGHLVLTAEDVVMIITDSSFTSVAGQVYEGDNYSPLMAVLDLVVVQDDTVAADNALMLRTLTAIGNMYA